MASSRKPPPDESQHPLSQARSSNAMAGALRKPRTLPEAAPAAGSPRPTGRCLIGGQWGEGDGDSPFQAFNPGTGIPTAVIYKAASAGQVERAGATAWQGFGALANAPASRRGDLLEAIADAIHHLGDALLDHASTETGLPRERLASERERTTQTLRMFAGVVREGSWVRASIDRGDEKRKPAPKPDLRRMLRPLGPVAVFGASNFPLAYSAMGTDAASALAAGCPVIVKGHPAHPATGELVARAVEAAIAVSGVHPGVYAYLPSGGAREAAVGQELVRNPFVRAVGFTGSFAGGMALSELARQREDPVPVFAEMGSINPVFLLPGALESGATALADRIYSSATASQGQMCTKPGLIFGVRSEGLQQFEKALADLFNRAQPHAMLSRKIRFNFARRLAEVSAPEGVDIRAGSLDLARLATSGQADEGPITALPALLRTRFGVFARTPTLRDECFGPSTLLVVCDATDQLFEAAALIRGSLTGSIFASGLDAALARDLQGLLEQRVGRLVYNGVPTGVEVVASMVHGGPLPASNQAHSTAVGPLAMERWCRPVCYQNAPDGLVPLELKLANPAGIWRMVDGEWTAARDKKA